MLHTNSDQFPAKILGRSDAMTRSGVRVSLLVGSQLSVDHQTKLTTPHDVK